MDTAFCYRGRGLSQEQIGFIQQLIDRSPGASRRQLSAWLCEAWDWRQANGGLRDMVCRGMMLALYRAGHIELPARKFTPPNPLAVRRQPATQIAVDDRPLEGALHPLQPLEFRQVRRRPEEALFNGLIESHHYLGYTQPVGEHLKYVVYARGRPVACLGWSSAPRHIGARDRFIGWRAPQRRRNLHLLAYNTRFLILPWVHVPHLASHILGKLSQRISADWQALYAHPVWYLETFVDRSRYRGTCYRAANWLYLGRTTGRGKDAWSKRPNRSLKDVLGYPLSKDFRDRLCEATP